MAVKIFITCITVFFLAGNVFCQTEEMEVKVFRLDHREARSMLPAVEHLKSGEGKVTVDQNSNSLIVVDLPENLERIAEVISMLDVAQKEVRINVTVAEVTDAFLGKIGMVSGQAIIPEDRLSEIQYLVNTSEDTNVITEMSLRTLSGQTAKLQVAREEILWGVTSTPEGSTITVSPAGIRAAGSFLEIFPNVNRDGSITITLMPSVSEFVDERTTQKREVIASVVVNSGDTIALGGLKSSKRRTRQERIPLTELSLPEKFTEEARIMVMFLTASVIE
ncbi:MAG: secretin N-terminal domain-containing protein [Candidatus Omnitrophota bacterium]